MKFLRVLSALLLFSSIPLCAELDVSAIKKSVAADLTALSKAATDEILKMAGEFKIHDAQSALILKTYNRDQHEAFRADEENKLVSRVSNNVQRLTTDVDGMIEKAVVDILKRQNDFDADTKKDIAVFKQQFSESIAKMLQGKSPTPVTYSSSEAVAKPVLNGLINQDVVPSGFDTVPARELDKKKILDPAIQDASVIKSMPEQGVKKTKKPAEYIPIQTDELMPVSAKPSSLIKTEKSLPGGSKPFVASAGSAKKTTSDQASLLTQIRG